MSTLIQTYTSLLSSGKSPQTLLPALEQHLNTLKHEKNSVYHEVNAFYLQLKNTK